ncbi:unnamed protein product [Linum tenue]|uniref:Uncharacterized protein n=1 Tax=Linum tenue TaxID=586396 RepID=A0AAV0RG01_9ROSI|nr:unnamed protein product [Linum tenue]
MLLYHGPTLVINLLTKSSLLVLKRRKINVFIHQNVRNHSQEVAVAAVQVVELPRRDDDPVPRRSQQLGVVGPVVPRLEHGVLG